MTLYKHTRKLKIEFQATPIYLYMYLYLLGVYQLSTWPLVCVCTWDIKSILFLQMCVYCVCSVMSSQYFFYKCVCIDQPPQTFVRTYIVLPTLVGCWSIGNGHRYHCNVCVLTNRHKHLYVHTWFCPRWLAVGLLAMATGTTILYNHNNPY